MTSGRVEQCAASGCCVEMFVVKRIKVTDSRVRFRRRLYCSEACLVREEARTCLICSGLFYPVTRRSKAAHCSDPTCVFDAKLRQFDLWLAGFGASPALPRITVGQSEAKCHRCLGPIPDGTFGKRYCSVACCNRAHANHDNHIAISQNIKGGPVPIDITLDEMSAVRVRSVTCECPACRVSATPRVLVFDGDDLSHPDAAQTDHIIERGHGIFGPHIAENCRPTTQHCNKTRPKDCSDVTASEARVILDALIRRTAERPGVATAEQVDHVRSFVEWREHAEAGGHLGLVAFREQRKRGAA